jgi:hypothetical protein
LDLASQDLVKCNCSTRGSTLRERCKRSTSSLALLLSENPPYSSSNFSKRGRHNFDIGSVEGRFALAIDMVPSNMGEAALPNGKLAFVSMFRERTGRRKGREKGKDFLQVRSHYE